MAVFVCKVVNAAAMRPMIGSPITQNTFSQFTCLYQFEKVRGVSLRCVFDSRGCLILSFPAEVVLLSRFQLIVSCEAASIGSSSSFNIALEPPNVEIRRYYRFQKFVAPAPLRYEFAADAVLQQSLSGLLTCETVAFSAVLHVHHHSSLPHQWQWTPVCSRTMVGDV